MSIADLKPKRLSTNLTEQKYSVSFFLQLGQHNLKKLHLSARVNQLFVFFLFAEALGLELLVD